MNTYKITRHWIGGRKKVVRTGLTLEQAQQHCQDPSTRGKNGQWFDSYSKEQ